MWPIVDNRLFGPYIFFVLYFSVIFIIPQIVVIYVTSLYDLILQNIKYVFEEIIKP